MPEAADGKPPSHEVSGVRWTQLDARDRSAVDRLIATVRPAAVVNAAYQRDDWALCADAAGYVAAAAAGMGSRLVHVSSDAIHGGRNEPYGDDEPPTPVYPYGAAKAAAETAVRTADPTAAIVRTSLIIGDAASTQVRLCLDLMTGRVAGALFADEIRCPVAVADLASAVLELTVGAYSGPLNVTGTDAVSRVELGELVAARYGLDASRIPVSTVAESGLCRPTDVRLDVTCASSLLLTRLRGVREVLS